MGSVEWVYVNALECGGGVRRDVGRGVGKCRGRCEKVCWG